MKLRIVRATFDCEEGSFGKKCWHVKLLEELVRTDEKIKEEIARAKEEMLKEGDIASRG